jgi:hypothetical protein
MAKILSPKNKKLAILVGAIFGGAVLAVAVYRAIKSGATDPKTILSLVWEQIKSMLSPDNAAMILVCVLSLIGISFLPTDANGFVTAVALGAALTTGAAAVTTLQTNYLPKYFSYVAATQLTGIKITMQGRGVIFDSDANGLSAWGVNRLIGQATNKYTFMLSNGFIPGMTCIWEFTNSAAQTPTVYGDNDETQASPGNRYILQGLRQAVQANSGQNFEDFATLTLPSISATDVVNVFYKDGTQQQMNREDILAKLQWSQSVINTPVYMIDNRVQNIKQVNVIAGVAQTAYVQRWGGPIGGKGMINQSINNS